LIASAICECQKRHVIDPEEAKTMAKCIIERLSDAGFSIAPNADKGTNKAEKAEVHRPGDASSPSSSLLKNLEMGVFLFLPVVVLGWRVDLDVIFQPGVGRPLTRGG
jgi:hypothetical protein